MAKPANSKNLVLLIRIPQGEEGKVKVESVFEQLLINLHKTVKNQKLSFEMISFNQHIYFYCHIPSHLYELVEGQIYAQYPDCEIETHEDYANIHRIKNSYIAGTEIALKRSDIYPFKMYDDFEGDSLASVFSVLTKCQANEQAWIQTVIRPLEDNWRLNFTRSWKRKLIRFKNAFRLKDYFKGTSRADIKKRDIEIFSKKAEQYAFRVNVKMAYVSPDKSKVVQKLSAMAKAYSQFDTIDYNEFKFVRSGRGKPFYSRYKSRNFQNNFVVSAKELASLYHFPNSDIVPHIVHIMAKKAEPPMDLPKASDYGPDQISVFGNTNYHNQKITFGIKRNDRRRHLYIVGKSGTGKSKLLELLINNDLQSGQGVGILDPHGDLVDNVLKYIPKERMKDVVYFNPADTEFPIAFNPLEQVDQDMKIRVTIGFIDIFKKLFASNWTPRLEHVLRYTTLALLDSPNTTILSILKMLSDKNYRQRIVANIQDSVIKNFWVNEFAAWSEKFDNEAIMPILNKVGQFVSTSLIRNIVGQPQNKIDLREIMDSGKILLMRISKGNLGEENAALIGAMVVTKIQQAAMSRTDTPEDQRRDFYLYCDEFQYFATDTFAEILSEARKYRLDLTMAHQYMGQLNETIRKTTFGNVGSIINFRVGAEDAGILEGEYNPVFKVRDIINLGVREFYIKMSVDGELRDAFSGRTIDVPKVTEDHTQEIIQMSREKYARPREEVEKDLKAWDEADVGKDEAEMKKMAADAGEEEFAAPIV